MSTSQLYFKSPDEANPVLGWRGVRIFLEWPDVFFTQVFLAP